MINEVPDSDVESASGTAFGRKENIFEVAVFLFLIVPSLALSFVRAGQGTLDFRLVAFATMLRDLALVSLILFFIWRNGEPVARLGWTFRNKGKDIALGVVLFIPLFFGSSALDGLLRSAGFTSRRFHNSIRSRYPRPRSEIWMT